VLTLAEAKRDEFGNRRMLSDMIYAESHKGRLIKDIAKEFYIEVPAANKLKAAARARWLLKNSDASRAHGAYRVTVLSPAAARNHERAFYSAHKGKGYA